MIRILVVCTGNVCRSPLAEQILSARVADLGTNVVSAGTRARTGMKMTPEAAAISIANGSERQRVESHEARLLTSGDLREADLTLAMTRDHRREVVELDVAQMRRAFTLREASALLEHLNDGDLERAAASAPAISGPRGRLAELLSLVANQRGLRPPSFFPAEADVIDPYGRSRRTYALSEAQILSALPAVERLLRIAYDK